MNDFKFELGDELKDVITGFKGIVRGRSQYLTGCNSYGIQSQKLSENGNPQEWKWFDEDQLTRVKKEKIVLNEKARETGGPNSPDQYPPS